MSGYYGNIWTPLVFKELEKHPLLTTNTCEKGNEDLGMLTGFVGSEDWRMNSRFHQRFSGRKYQYCILLISLRHDC
jgi:hypothetical protein